MELNYIFKKVVNLKRHVLKPTITKKNTSVVSRFSLYHVITIQMFKTIRRCYDDLPLAKATSSTQNKKSGVD